MAHSLHSHHTHRFRTLFGGNTVIGLCSSVSPSMDTLIWKDLSNFSSSLLSVSMRAISHNCCEYVVSNDVRITNGPLARIFLSLAFVVFAISVLAFTSAVVVIGGPANPMKMPRPKQAKNAKNTITNSRLFIEYRRICTERSQRSWWYAGAMYLLNSLKRSLNCDNVFRMRSNKPPDGRW